MAAVGEGRMTAGAEAIVRAADSTDPRPLWISVWGGANTLAQALWHVRATRPAADLERIVSKLRVYTISDQDDAGPWLRREFPALHYIATPGDHVDYYLATWTGIAGDEFYRNGAGADFTTVSEAWVNEHMRKKGPLGAFYPLPCCIIEGRHAGFLEPHEQRIGVVHESDVRRMGRPIRVAAALAGDAAVLDKLPRVARHGDWHRRQELHVGPGNDLAVAGSIPARLRRAHGLDDQGRCAGQSQPGRGRERRRGEGAAVTGGDGRHTDRPGGGQEPRPGWQRAAVFVVLLSGSRDRTAQRRRRQSWRRSCEPLPLRAPRLLRVRDARPAFHPHRQEDGPRRRLWSRSPMARVRSPPSRPMRPASRT